MRSNLTRKLISAALFAVMVLFGVSAIPAQAQRLVVERHPRVFIHTGFFPRPWWGPNYYVVDPVAYQQDQGYRDGLSRGKSDAEHGRPNDPNNHKHFRNAESLTYRNAFAQGYETGYEQRS